MRRFITPLLALSLPFVAAGCSEVGTATATAAAVSAVADAIDGVGDAIAQDVDGQVVGASLGGTTTASGEQVKLFNYSPQVKAQLQALRAQQAEQQKASKKIWDRTFRRTTPTTKPVSGKVGK